MKCFTCAEKLTSKLIQLNLLHIPQKIMEGIGNIIYIEIQFKFEK